MNIYIYHTDDFSPAVLRAEKSSATVLYNCELPDDGPARAETFKSWFVVILINLCTFVGSNCNDDDDDDDIHNNNNNNNNLVPPYNKQLGDVIQIMWKGGEITVQLNLNCSYYIHMTSPCLTTQ